ncbi:hypothetical protein HHL22_01805 [Hymenobacter sp. RP-2-7]|uniref:Ppx/GppA phosphatase domain-containing protein n=1 Tax=Hymenobacter polaris TaxID=2682546 RepID=A0A7Y0FKP8_9BACT|nr:hypothetical protein [Hymenobacter polaris]NML63928.1 hypothetical protein [Hymenobacter polaris]
MKNSTFTRILLGVLVLAIMGMTLKIVSSKAAKPTTTLVEEPAADTAHPAKASAALHPEQVFNYVPLKPVGGKLRGVVELGASGFNSFIVRTDALHNWQLQKAEYDNSLIMENMASDEDIRRGLRAYITKMLDYGVAGRDIHFVVSSGALKVLATHRIVAQLAHMHYVVNTMTPAKEAALGLNVALPPLFGDRAFVVDIGSGGTEISWQQAGKTQSVDTYGSKYYEHGVADDVVALDAKHQAEQVPISVSQTCFIMGGVPFEMAKQVRKGKERYTVLSPPDEYQFESAKGKAGVVIYKAVAQATGCKKFIFDWDANFTIGYLLSLPQ